MHQLINLDFCGAFNIYPREKLIASSCRRTFREYHEINNENVIQLHPHCQQEGVLRRGTVIQNPSQVSWHIQLPCSASGSTLAQQDHGWGPQKFRCWNKKSSWSQSVQLLGYKHTKKKGKKKSRRLLLNRMCTLARESLSAVEISPATLPPPTLLPPFLPDLKCVWTFTQINLLITNLDYAV